MKPEEGGKLSNMINSFIKEWQKIILVILDQCWVLISKHWAFPKSYKLKLTDNMVCTNSIKVGVLNIHQILMINMMSGRRY